MRNEVGTHLFLSEKEIEGIKEYVPQSVDFYERAGQTVSDFVYESKR